MQTPGRAHRRQPGMRGAPRAAALSEESRPPPRFAASSPHEPSLPVLSPVACHLLAPGRRGVQGTGLDEGRGLAHDHTGSRHQREMISSGVCGPASAASLCLVTPADPPQAAVSSPRSHDAERAGNKGRRLKRAGNVLEAEPWGDGPIGLRVPRARTYPARPALTVTSPAAAPTPGEMTRAFARGHKPTGRPCWNPSWSLELSGDGISITGRGERTLATCGLRVHGDRAVRWTESISRG